MNLYIKDRIYIPQMLKKTNSFMEFNLKRHILAKVAITEDEVKKYEIDRNDKAGTVVWNAEKDKNEPLQVDFTQEELQYLTKSCEELSESQHPDGFWEVVEKLYDAGERASTV